MTLIIAMMLTLVYGVSATQLYTPASSKVMFCVDRVAVLFMVGSISSVKQ